MKQNSKDKPKERIVVICPGRGSYTKNELGYLNQDSNKLKTFVKEIDRWREEKDEVSVSDLDQADIFKAGVHTKGHNASTLIYACSYSDFIRINQDKYDIVAITGNSMGWYLAMAMSKALSPKGAFEVINTMGSMMKEKLVGGQIIYPITDDQWRKDPKQIHLCYKILDEVNSVSGNKAYVSIKLGGYLVIGGNKQALSLLLKKLSKVGDYPFQLINHGAFHTPLLKEISKKAFELLPLEFFRQPEVPIIDGEGKVWTPYSTDVEDLYSYTLGAQVTEVYDFSKAISVALKEFAPDKLVLLGPGSSLGGAVGQTLIENDWLGIKDKETFKLHQEKTPTLLSMGRVEQREVLL